MNNKHQQLVKIYLERTNPQNPAARRDIAGAKERAKKSGQSFKRGSLRRGLAADDARVRRGEKPRHTTKAQGQEAMRLDPDHPADRRRVGESSIVGALAVGGAQHLGKEAVAKLMDVIKNRRTKKKRKEEEDAPLGESIWDIYKNLGHIISEVLKTPYKHAGSVVGGDLEAAQRRRNPHLPAKGYGGGADLSREELSKAARLADKGTDAYRRRERRLEVLRKGTTGIRGTARRARGKVAGVVLDPDKNPEARTKRTGAGLPERS